MLSSGSRRSLLSAFQAVAVKFRFPQLVYVVYVDRPTARNLHIAYSSKSEGLGVGESKKRVPKGQSP